MKKINGAYELWILKKGDLFLYNTNETSI